MKYNIRHNINKYCLTRIKNIHYIHIYKYRYKYRYKNESRYVQNITEADMKK